MESAAAAWSRGLYRPIRAFVPRSVYRVTTVLL